MNRRRISSRKAAINRFTIPIILVVYYVQSGRVDACSILRIAFSSTHKWLFVYFSVSFSYYRVVFIFCYLSIHDIAYSLSRLL